MLADIFVTTTNRADLLRKSLQSLKDNTDRSQFRLTVIRDGDYLVSYNAIRDGFIELVDHVLTHRETLGLGPSINQALAHIDSLKRWDGVNAPPFTIYLQDDVLYTRGWLDRLAKMFLIFEKPHRLGFASGIESIEHPIRKDLGNGMVLKDWIRATCMFARHETWMSMWPISRIDPETGRERGRPHDGLGSSVDWWFIRNHENSVCKTGRTNLVIPGLLQHAGYNKSTWLKRDLPESELDKLTVEKFMSLPDDVRKEIYKEIANDPRIPKIIP